MWLVKVKYKLVVHVYMLTSKVVICVCTIDIY